MLQLNGKRAMITGASRGIGHAIAELFAQNGAQVIANARREDQLQVAIQKIPNCQFIAGDVTKFEQAVDLVEQAYKNLGGLDVIVCNVGSGSSVPPGEENIEEWHKMFSKNFFSAVNVIEAAKPILKRGNSIICISSICGNEVIPGAPICYSTAKSALNSYVNAVSRYFGKKGIRINALAPGNVLFEGSVWDLKLKTDPINTNRNVKTEVPLSSFASTEDIANAAMWLASENSKFVNGSLLTVDGGQTRSI